MIMRVQWGSGEGVGGRRKGGGGEGAERTGEAKRDQNKGEEGEEGRAKTKKGKGR